MAFDSALAADFLKEKWEPYLGDTQSMWQQGYASLLLHSKIFHKQVIGIDTDPEYTKYRGNTQLTLVTRNYIWTQNIPTSSRGIILGGNAHFNHHLYGNVQDFLLEKNKRAVFLFDIKDLP